VSTASAYLGCLSKSVEQISSISRYVMGS